MENKSETESILNSVLGLIKNSKFIQIGIMAIMFGVAMSVIMGGKIDIFGVVTIEGEEIPTESTGIDSSFVSDDFDDKIQTKD